MTDTDKTDSTQAARDVNSESESPTPRAEHHEIIVPNIGTFNAYIQGSRCYNEVVILTVHDLGCDHTMYMDFVDSPEMARIRNRTVWIHVDVPGQGQHAPDLPADYQFPKMQQLGEAIIHVLDQLKIKEVVCFGEGAGANILARFAISHQERVLGVCLIHCTGTTAGFIESVKDKLINWRLDHIGMNPSAEAYLVIHRFGLANKNTDQDMLKSAIENYQEVLRQRTNPKNLKKFVDAFLKRTSLADPIKKLKCPVLMVTGSKSMFNMTTRNLHQILVKSSKDKDKVEFIEVAGVANVLEEKPQKLAECFQYFLQGLGLVSSVPMHHVTRLPRMRSLSMEEYDKPLRQRSISGGGQESPLSGSPSNSDPPIPQSVTN